jgi:4-diphosphocytidyl-2-C-methyl-D-erythritol kinase
VLIASPPVQIATPDAYGWWDQMNPSPAARGPVVLDAESFATWGSIGRLGGNDFEAPVFAKHPELRAVYERLAGTGPIWVRLCGSGSAVAAAYKKEKERDDAAQRLGEKAHALIKTATRSG